MRIAGQSDRTKVLALFETVEDWRDFIPSDWDRWLLGNDGKLFVATANDEVGGTSYLRFLDKDTCWLEGHIVHPRYRRIGLGSALNVMARRYAKDKGFKTVRLAIDSTNTAAISKVLKHRFRALADFLEYEGEPPAPRSGKVELAKIEDREAVWRIINNSPTFVASHGFYSCRWVWRPLNKRELAYFVLRRNTLFSKDKSGIEGVLIFQVLEEYEQQRVSICYVDGSTECVGLMLGKLRELVGRRVITAYAYPPANSNLGEELSYYGLSAKTNIRVFEISLDEEIV